MKKYILILLSQLLFTTVLFGQTVSKYTSANLDLRTEPTATSKVLTVLPKGTEVTLQENCDCEWILVSYSGSVGYVSSKYLTYYKVKQEKTTYSKPVSGHKKYYTNSAGERVQSPTYYNSAPAGATALCGDGTYSFSRSRRGTCSHHGGVARWL